MRVYQLKEFAKWANRERISDRYWIEVVKEMNSGLLGDRLGACIYKKRLKIKGKGKRGGGRVIVLFKNNDLTLFLYGYLKNEQSNLTKGEEQQLRIFASEFLKLTTYDLEKHVANGKLTTIKE